MSRCLSKLKLKTELEWNRQNVANSLSLLPFNIEPLTTSPFNIKAFNQILLLLIRFINYNLTMKAQIYSHEGKFVEGWGKFWIRFNSSSKKHLWFNTCRKKNFCFVISSGALMSIKCLFSLSYCKTKSN